MTIKKDYHKAMAGTLNRLSGIYLKKEYISQNEEMEARNRLIEDRRRANPNIKENELLSMDEMEKMKKNQATREEMIRVFKENFVNEYRLEDIFDNNKKWEILKGIDRLREELREEKERLIAQKMRGSIKFDKILKKNSILDDIDNLAYGRRFTVEDREIKKFIR
jgi:hypothetical protein